MFFCVILKELYILSNFEILSSMFGCVENIFVNFFLKGSDINRGATALGNLRLSSELKEEFFIFFNAEVNPGG